jgi:fumarate reductase iron-sulfur subunit
MGEDFNQITILARRKIEAEIAGPLARAFMNEIGKEKTLKVFRGVIDSLALKSGIQLAETAGGNSIAHLAEGLGAWATGDAYEMEVLELNDTVYNFDITRCSYAEMYKELGMSDLGLVLSCGRDFQLIKGFNPRMNLVRTKTIMEGCDRCDFRISTS